MPHRNGAPQPGAIVSETEMHADIRADSIDRLGQGIEEELGLAGMAGEAGLVELDEVDPGGHQSFELGVDDRDQGAGDGLASVIGASPIDAARECEWPGDGHLDWCAGKFAQPAKFLDRPQPVWRGERAHGSVPVALIVRGCSPESRARNWLDPPDVLVEAEVEIHPLHFSIRDPVEARAKLVVDCQTRRRRGRPRHGPPRRRAQDAP